MANKRPVTDMLLCNYVASIYPNKAVFRAGYISQVGFCGTGASKILT